MALSFVEQTFTADDLASLGRLAQLLRASRHQIAAEWSQRLMDLLPGYFASGDTSVSSLTELNEGFLALVLDHMERGEMAALYEMYYATSRQFIESDLQRAPALRISLSTLYTSARVSLRVIE